ncbi:unnamed protein product [Ectocarpus sp. 12 AP-2014]
MAPLIRQVFDPEENTCTVRAKEAFGEDWRRNLTTPLTQRQKGKSRPHWSTLSQEALT